MALDGLAAHGEEGPEAHVEGDEDSLDPLGVEGGEDLVGKVEASRGAGRRARHFRVDILVALDVGGVVVPLDVGGKRDMSHPLEVGLVDGGAEAQEARRVPLIVERPARGLVGHDLGLHALGEAVAPAGPLALEFSDRCLPDIRAAATQEEKLELRACVLGLAVDPRLADPRIVEDHEGPRLDEACYIAGVAVLELSRLPVHDEEPGLAAALGGKLSDELLGELKIEIVRLHVVSPFQDAHRRRGGRPCLGACGL